MPLPQNPEDWARLGARIRAERERQGLSRKELAGLARVSTGSIQSAENGAVPRARWPQSLSAIEHGLAWAPGSMKEILAGGDPKPFPDPRDPQSYYEIKGAEGATTVGRANGEGWENIPRSDLPEEIEKALPYVSMFGSQCVAHGAPAWLGQLYDNAVSALLTSLDNPHPFHYQPHRPLKKQARTAVLETYRQQYELVANRRNPLLEVLEKERVDQVATEKVQREIEQLHDDVVQLPPSIRKAAVLDMYEKLEPVLRDETGG